MVEAMMGRLAWPLDRLLEEQAPEALEVPTGNRIRLQYEAGKAAGVGGAVAGGVRVDGDAAGGGGAGAGGDAFAGAELSAGADYADLRSFWGTTYFQVRKDLRAKYPKHSWPEDPLTATPVAKGRRRN